MSNRAGLSFWGHAQRTRISDARLSRRLASLLADLGRLDVGQAARGREPEKRNQLTSAAVDKIVVAVVGVSGLESA